MTSIAQQKVTAGRLGKGWDVWTATSHSVSRSAVSRDRSCASVWGVALWRAAWWPVAAFFSGGKAKEF